MSLRKVEWREWTISEGSVQGVSDCRREGNGTNPELLDDGLRRREDLGEPVVGREPAKVRTEERELGSARRLMEGRDRQREGGKERRTNG